MEKKSTKLTSLLAGAALAGSMNAAQADGINNYQEENVASIAMSIPLGSKKALDLENMTFSGFAGTQDEYGTKVGFKADYNVAGKSTVLSYAIDASNRFEEESKEENTLGYSANPNNKMGMVEVPVYGFNKPVGLLNAAGEEGATGFASLSTGAKIATGIAVLGGAYAISEAGSDDSSTTTSDNDTTTDDGGTSGTF